MLSSHDGRVKLNKKYRSSNNKMGNVASVDLKYFATPNVHKHHFDKDIAPYNKVCIYKTLPKFWVDVFEADTDDLNWTELSSRDDLTLDIVYKYSRTHYCKNCHRFGRTVNSHAPFLTE